MLTLLNHRENSDEAVWNFNNASSLYQVASKGIHVTNSALRKFCLSFQSEARINEYCETSSSHEAEQYWQVEAMENSVY
jgi:hypothetical protein